MMSRLKQWVSETALYLYLSNRVDAIAAGKEVSSSSLLTHGVPQGLILGPILFPLFMLLHGHLFW